MPWHTHGTYIQPNINESNKVLMTCLLKPFIASQLNLETLQDFHLSYKETKFCVTCAANMDMQLNPFKSAGN